MKKILGLLACVIAIGVITGKLTFARLTSPYTQTDAWCAGIDGAEVCVDSSGNLFPTTTNDTTCGTSTYRWANVYSTLLNISGLATTTAITNTGTLTQTGAVTQTGGAVSFNVGTSSMTVLSKIKVSSATVTAADLYVLGAYATLPTSGVLEGTLAYQTSDHRLYLATMTVVSAGSWLAQ